MNKSYRTTCTIFANGNGQPKAWSAIRYTIKVNLPMEGGVFAVTTMTNIQSANKWPDDPVDIQPAAVGSIHPFIAIDGVGEAFIREYPAMSACVTAAQSNAQRLKVLQRFQIGGVGSAQKDTDKQVGGTGIGGGGGPSGSPGGGGFGGGDF